MGLFSGESHGQSVFSEWHLNDINTRNRTDFHKLINDDVAKVSRLNSKVWHINFKHCDTITALDIAYLITEQKRLRERGHHVIIVIYVSDRAIRLFGDIGRLDDYFEFRKADENMYSVDEEIKKRLSKKSLVESA